MRKPQSNRTLLSGGVAAVVLLGGGGLFLALNRSDARPAAEGEAGHAEEEGHAEGEGAEAPEGVVALTAEQIRAAGIAVVAVGTGGGSETRLAGRVEPRVDARAAVGGGSEFEICVPRLMGDAGEPAAAPPEEAQQTQQQAQLRVLVVDDNRDAAELLGSVLEVLGHAVSVEYDGRGALARARRERPQVMLLDIGLPDTDGYALARQLRAMPELAGTVLVALTGYGQPEDLRQAEEAGFNHHLVKPADLGRVTEILAQVQEAKR